MTREIVFVTANGNFRCSNERPNYAQEPKQPSACRAFFYAKKREEEEARKYNEKRAYARREKR